MTEQLNSCPFCGFKIEGGFKFCPNCGREQELGEPRETNRFQLRAWATWENDEGIQTTNGDPDWSQRPRDQQGIPAYRVSVSLQPD